MNLKEVIKVLSEVGKQKDINKALRELEEVEKAVHYVKKVISRRIMVDVTAKRLECKQVVEGAIE